MATISERLAYILTADNKQFVSSFQQAGAAADKELGKADSKLDKLGGNLTKVGAGAVAFAGIAGAGLVKVALGASDLAESVNAVNVTFGDAAEGILQLGEEAARSVGLSKSEFNGLAVQFSSFAETVAGKGGDVVGTMDTLTTRVADFASVMNLDVPKAAEIFQSALAGETEPIKKFGIDLSAASVAAFAVANGISASAASMTEAEKVQARYGLLMESTNKTAGDFANTSDGLANQQRILKAELKNLSDGIGTGVLPMLTSIVSVAGKVTHAFAELSPESQALVGKFAAIGVAGIGMLGTISLIAGQVIKMRTRFHEADGTLNTFGKTAKGLGITLGVVAVALIAWEGGQQRLAGSLQDSIRKTEELGRVTDEALGRTFLLAVAAATMGGKSLEEALSMIAKANLEGAQRALEHAAAIGLNAAETAQLKAAIDAEITARKTQAKTTEEYAEAEEGATEAIEASASATDNLKASMEGGISTSQVAEQAGKALADQHEATADAAEEQAEALADLIATMIDAVGGTFNLEKATQNLQLSYLAYQEQVLATSETLKDSEVTDRDKEKSVRELRLAEIALAEEALATAVAYAQEKGAADGSTQSAHLQIVKLQELQRTFPELRDEIQRYIDQLNRIPTAVTTVLNDSRGVFRNARGTDNFAGGLSIVGEEGPELVGLPRGSAVFPADETREMLSGNGGGLGGATMNFYSNGPPTIADLSHALTMLKLSR